MTSNSPTVTVSGARNLNENPLITVSGGEVADLILSNLSTQITSDLGRESIDWHRAFDPPISVYLEASFVKLDPEKHLLSEQILSSSRLGRFTPPPPPPNGQSHLGHHRQLSTSSAYSSIPYRGQVQGHPTLSGTQNTSSSNAAAVKRNHSFNVIRRTDSSILGRSGLASTSESITTTTTESNNGSLVNGRLNIDPGTTGSVSPDEQVNHPLERLLATRFQRTNGAQVLVNSFWIDAAQDLESYSASVREPLLDWFSRLLANTAANCRLGLSTEFTLDCAIVIVKRVKGAGAGQRPGTPTKSNNEQVLSLDRLIADQHQHQQQQPRTPAKSAQSSSLLKSSFGFSGGKKFSSKPATPSNLATSLSSSLTSLPNATSGHLHSASSTNQLITPATLPPAQLSPNQLIDQLRNDLAVCFQLFQQKQLSTGSLDPLLLHPHAQTAILSQLMERILVFDYSSNIGSESASGTASPARTASSSQSSVSTMKQLSSALSNFSSGGSIKITPPSLMSPVKSAAAKVKGQAIPESASIPVLKYSAFVGRLRSLLLDAYSRQVITYERLIRRQRELRNKVDWDFFGFFLLQEELALAYENLGLYSKALIQYDELEALFSQSILNTNASGGIGPAWLQRRLLGDDEDHVETPTLKDSGLVGPLGGHSADYPALYNSWNGLCLCNPEAINGLRGKIVQCVLAEDGCGADGLLDVDEEYLDSPSSPLRSSGPMSFDSYSDPLGVNLGVSSSGRLGSSPTKGPRSLTMTTTTATDLKTNYSGQISLIDFRNYLFARQCHLLCLLNKPWELASRALPFLQTCVSELNLLEISIAPGGIACWVFLSVLEILHKCERYSDSSQLESYSYHTVGLWSYARDKLAELGKLCNLMPGYIDSSRSSSYHLQRMVELVAGMGADPHIRTGSGAGGSLGSTEATSISPQERLKTALSSSADFLANYLEMTELTMGTYKHIGYIRSARLIGKELSQLYLQLHKPQQALPFLLDHYNLFQSEQWSVLKYEASRLLAQCLEALYFSAYETKGEKTEVTDEEAEGGGATEPAFNLEATVRSAFRTYLLLLVKRTETGTGIQTPEVTTLERQQYISALVKLLTNYAANGLSLGQIAEKILPPAEADLTMAKLDSSRPLLTIHNSHSDLFYDSYASSSSMMLAANSVSSLHRLNSSTSASVKGSRLGASDGSLGSSPPTGSGTLGGGYSNPAGSPQVDVPANSSPPKPRPRKLGEHFLKVVSIELTSSDQANLGVTSTSSSSSSHRADRSFIAGSRLVMTLQIISELSISLPLQHLLVTMDVRSGAAEAGGRKKSSHSMSSGSAGSTEQLDGPELAGRLQGSYLHPYGIMEVYNNPSGGAGAGIVCRNVDYLLKHPARSSTSALKFLPQLPVSLLNQRLADDSNNFRHYRFLGAPFLFELMGGGQKNLELRPGLNTFQLVFQSPDQFSGLVKTQISSSAKRSLMTGLGAAPCQVNQLWFHFDQLVFLCGQVDLDRLEDDRPTSGQTFAIVEDFNALHATSTVNAAALSANFRLVKCPPTVELMPKTADETDRVEAAAEVVDPNAGHRGYTSLLIGVDQLVTLRLNSGTNILPKGLKCFLKITPQLNSIPMPSAIDLTSDPATALPPSSFDYRLITVTLHQPTSVSSFSKDDSILYFHLDRQIEPFQTYELLLKLRSNYTRAQVCSINTWAVPPSAGSGAGSSAVPSLNSSTANLLSPKPVSSNSRDFILTISWSALEPSSTPIQAISASATFTLHHPYHLYTKLHTAATRKLIEVGLRGSAELAGHRLQLRQPILSHYHYSHNQKPKTAETTGTTASISFKPLIQYQDPESRVFPLVPNADLHFIWELLTDNTDAMDLATLKRFMLDITYQDGRPGEPAATAHWISVPYEVRLTADLSTRYLIREYIEPMSGQKNTELLRVGNSCLFRVTIERLFGQSKTTTAEDETNEASDEYVMYELVYDSELWSVVSSYRGVEANAAAAGPTGPYDSISSGLTGPTSDYSSLYSSGPESTRSGGATSGAVVPPNEFNVLSRVLKLTPTEPLFEANFEMMPLTDGYIPLPTLRLSRYQPAEAETVLSTSGGLQTSSTTPTPASSAESLRDAPDGGAFSKTSAAETPAPKTTIESLSSLSKNWTQKLLNSTPSSKYQQVPTGTPTRGEPSSGSQIRSGKLIAFESGQVYNYNRASQIYILPAAQPVSMLVEGGGGSGLDQAPASLVSITS